MLFYPRRGGARPGNARIGCHVPRINVDADTQQGTARPRQERSVRNDEAILRASVGLLADEGTAGLALGRVARRAGLSVRPVRDRYSDRTALAAAVWDHLLAPTWAESIEAVIAAADSGDERALLAALTPFARPADPHRAAGELLMLAAHDEGVRAIVSDAAIAPLTRVLGGSGVGRTRAAAQGYAAMLALGLLLESWREGATEVDLSGLAQRVSAAFRAQAKPRRLPSAAAPHLDEGAVIDTGDPLWDAVLRATLRQVGTRGYEAATVESIVAEAGCSQTVLFRRYATKREAFLDATRRMFGAATALNVAYQQRMAKVHSPGVAEAIILREYMRPGREVERVIGLEQYRLAWHDHAMREALQAEQRPVQEAFLRAHADLPPGDARALLHAELAMGMGTVLLAQLVPEAWALPYDVVTVPLIDRALASTPRA